MPYAYLFSKVSFLDRGLGSQGRRCQVLEGLILLDSGYVMGRILQKMLPEILCLNVACFENVTVTLHKLVKTMLS